MSYRILLVDPSVASSAAAERTLALAGYRAAAVNTFEQALRQIALNCPDVLITAVRLAAFNGLHLLIRVRAEHADLPVIITGHIADFSPDASRFGARYLATPVDPILLLQNVTELLAGRPPLEPLSDRRWPRRPAGLPATVHNTRAHVVELSYGGLRLKMNASAAAPSDEPFEVKLPSVGMTVRAVPRWAGPTDESGERWCGAELTLPGDDVARNWRTLVDSLH